MKVICFFYALLLPLLTQAQVYRDVVRSTGGVTTTYSVYRDTTVYHQNQTGDAALTAAIRAGTLPLLSPAKTSQAVGSFTYKPNGLYGTDFSGTAFVATAAPVLIAASRTIPRPVGNFFTLSPQQAKQTGLLRRLTAFSLHPSKTVVYAGPNFSSAADRVQLTRGFTDLDECVQGRTLISSNRYVPLINGGYAGLAGSAAASLPDNDSRKAPLLGWASGKTFIANPDAAKLFGRAIYANLYTSAGNANPTGYSLDFEDGTPASGSDGFTVWQSMVGNVMQGIKDAATELGRPVPVPFSYDFASISPFGLFCSQADQNADGSVNDGCNGVTGLDSPEPGVPYYFHYKSLYATWAGGTKSAPLGKTTAISAYAGSGNTTAFGQAEYMNAPWDEQSLWQKNGDGTFKTRTVGGKTLLTIRNDQRTATLYGVAVPILSDDAYQYIYKGRERIQQAIVDMYWRAGGKHLPLSTDRQAGFENLKLVQWFRFDAEFKSRDPQGNDGEQLNRRPLNADFLERDVIVHTLLRDVIRVFGENGPMIQQGMAGSVSSNGYTTYDPLKSKGPVEIFTKGLYRASQFNYLGDTPWQLVAPRYFVHRGREDQASFLAQDQPEKNPIILGGLVPNATGGAKFWVLWSYDCQDVNQTRDLYFWYRKDDGTTSPNSYKVQFQGRKTGLEDVLLPPGFSGIAPKNVRFRFVDMTGETQTLTGDYRITGSNAETMPPLLTLGTTTTTPPATTTTAPPSTTTTAPPSTTTAPTTFSTAAVSGTGVQVIYSCTASTVRVRGGLASGSNLAIYLFQNNVLVASKDGTAGPAFDFTFTSSVPGNGVYKARVFEPGNDPNTSTSPDLTVSCGSSTTTGNGGGGGGGSPPPGTAFNYPVPTSSASWPAYNGDYLVGAAVGDVSRLESSYITLEVRKRFGGAIQITDKATGRKLVDYDDFGRESEMTFYGGPLNFSQAAGPPWGGIGWDPITAGDDGMHGSPVQFYGLVTGNDGIPRIYVKTQLLNWPDGKTTASRLLECWSERWYGIESNGKGVDVKARITFARSDNTFYEGINQEYPCFMVPGNLTNTYYYTGSSPYTGASVTQTTNIENGGQNKPFGQTDYNISEPWVATEYDRSGHFIFLNTDKLHRVASTLYVLQNGSSDSEGADPTTYNTANNTLTLDPNGVWYHNYGFYVTSNFNEGRSWANARPRKYGDTPNFTFDVAHGRNDWYVTSGTDQREPFSGDGWHVTMVPSRDQAPEQANTPVTARRSQLHSPAGSWKLTGPLYVRLKYSGSQNQMVIKYVMNGQRHSGLDGNYPNQMATQFPNGAADESVQYLTFNLINDGQYHTYTIPTSSIPAGRVVQEWVLRYNYDNSVIPQETIDLLYFGTTNPG